MGMYVYLSPLPLTFFLLHRVKMEEQAHQMVWSLLLSSKPLWPLVLSHKHIVILPTSEDLDGEAKGYMLGLGVHSAPER